MADGPNKILTGKELSKAIKEVPALVAEKERLEKELVKLLRSLPENHPQREEILAVLPPDALEQKELRQSWGSKEWLAHASYLKDVARKYNLAGHTSKAEECQRDAALAQETGKRLRADGR